MTKYSSGTCKTLQKHKIYLWNMCTPGFPDIASTRHIYPADVHLTKIQILFEGKVGKKHFKRQISPLKVFIVLDSITAATSSSHLFLPFLCNCRTHSEHLFAFPPIRQRIWELSLISYAPSSSKDWSTRPELHRSSRKTS